MTMKKLMILTLAALMLLAVPVAALASDYDDYDEDEGGSIAFQLGVTVLVPLAIAGIVCGVWRGQMKTAKLQRAADSYIPKDGFKLTGKTDQYLYRTVTRRKIKTD